MRTKINSNIMTMKKKNMDNRICIKNELVSLPIKLLIHLILHFAIIINNS